MPKTRSVKLKISNCVECPHMKKVPSIIFDSWDIADEDAGCTKAEGNHKYRYGIIKGKAIEVMERWWKPHHTAIPDWCPLLKEKP